jgi:hypothetical protein
MKKLFLLAAISSAFLASCQKNNSPLPDNASNITVGVSSKSLIVKDTEVYVAGAMQSPGWSTSNPSSVAVYWKNGVAYPLSATPGAYTSRAQAIIVAGADVYVAGYDHGTYIVNQYSAGTPCYWKNGIEYLLPIPAGHIGNANAIAVSGTDVYVVGYYITNDDLHTRRAMLWKNGVATLLSFNNDDSQATGVAIDGTDVYICGDATFNTTYNKLASCAVYWKNNIWHPFAGTKVMSQASAIVVDKDHHIYISGAFNSNVLGCFWKDGAMHSFSGDLWVPISNGAYKGQYIANYFSNNIAVNNGVVYMGGAINNPSNAGDIQPAYWKNEQSVALPNKFSGDVAGGGSAIQVVGSDIYMTIAATDPFADDQYFYSKNNKTTALTKAVYAAGIAVVTH